MAHGAERAPQLDWRNDDDHDDQDAVPTIISKTRRRPGVGAKALDCSSPTRSCPASQLGLAIDDRPKPFPSPHRSSSRAFSRTISDRLQLVAHLVGTTIANAFQQAPRTDDEAGLRRFAMRRTVSVAFWPNTSHHRRRSSTTSTDHVYAASHPHPQPQPPRTLPTMITTAANAERTSAAGPSRRRRLPYRTASTRPSAKRDGSERETVKRPTSTTTMYGLDGWDYSPMAERKTAWSSPAIAVSTLDSTRRRSKWPRAANEARRIHSSIGGASAGSSDGNRVVSSSVDRDARDLEGDWKRRRSKRSFERDADDGSSWVVGITMAKGRKAAGAMAKERLRG
ncbi:hypothetical protein DFP72DRAFT_1175200 [Ephemerocybe angulata]|uniref:Uncharacterized protein n=1 Tax=Ephemerocybe angulata TaxID=980116 RepID=A0A8H6HHT5_9AGAR|nr:hypothetical protein DFP72DRAFT_1175200 [Tulosesus angulatus]